jgi:hypothetical protein
MAQQPAQWIPLYNDRTVQRAEGGMSQMEAEEMRQRIELWLDPNMGAEQMQEEMDAFDEIARLGRGNAVNHARRLAVARGVQVVVDNTLPHIFVGDDLPDEGPAPPLPAATNPRLHDGTGVVSRTIN